MKSSRTRAETTDGTTDRGTDKTTGPARWTRTARGPWAVVCAVATVVLGPAAVTASALDQANAAPPHHAVRADRPQAHLPSDSTRRRTAGRAGAGYSRKRSHSCGNRSASARSFSKSTGVPSGSAGAGAMPRSGATVPVSCS